MKMEFLDTSRVIRWFVCIFTVAVIVVTFNLNWNYFHDDAYITFRYAAQFLAGNGFVWNPGEFVQGYSNFLFLVLITFLSKFGVPFLHATYLIIILSYLGITVVIAWYCKDFEVRNASAKIWRYSTVMIVAGSVPIIVWILGGLETVFFTFLCMMATIFACKGFRMHDRRVLVVSSVFFGLAIITRLDAALFGAVTGVFAVRRFGLSGWRQLLALAIPVMVILLCYEIWVSNYYGDLLPNTYYAKVSALNFNRLSSGADYLLGFLLEPPFVLLAFIVGAFMTIAVGQGSFSVKYILALVLIYVTYIVYVGGDHMPAYRFFVPLIPISAIGLFSLLCTTPWVNRGVIASLIFVFLIQGMLLQLLPGNMMPWVEDPAARSGKIVGKYISRHWPEDSLVALHTAGSTPFFAPHLKFIDMLGLNDHHIARRKIEHPMLEWQLVAGHSKGDGRYVLSRKPTHIILGGALGRTAGDVMFLSDFELNNLDEFHEKYSKRTETLNEFGEPVKHGPIEFIWYQRICCDSPSVY